MLTKEACFYMASELAVYSLTVGFFLTLMLNYGYFGEIPF